MKKFILLFLMLLLARFSYAADIETISPTIEGVWTFNDVIAHEVKTIIDGDTTPDIRDANIFITSSNTGATAIVDLDDPTTGQIIIIIGGSNTNSSTIADAGNFNLSAAWTASLDDILVLFVKADNSYIEISRSNN